MSELVDGPQVDAGSVEGEAQPVVDAGVLAEPVQEDDGRRRLGSGLMPVVGAAAVVIDEGHDLSPPAPAVSCKSSTVDPSYIQRGVAAITWGHYMGEEGTR